MWLKERIWICFNSSVFIFTPLSYLENDATLNDVDVLDNNNNDCDIHEKIICLMWSIYR